MNDLIREKSEKYRDAFAEVAKSGIKEYSCDIDCANLRDFKKEDITGKSSEYKEIFDVLKEIKGPCVYYFEILSNINKDIIIKKFDACKENTPALKKKTKDSKILYVGKVEGFNSDPGTSAIGGRLIMHLGFHTYKDGEKRVRSNVHGLHLFDWAREIGLKLRFHVFDFEFNEDTKGLVGIIEKDFAKRLEPIIGRH